MSTRSTARARRRAALLALGVIALVAAAALPASAARGAGAASTAAPATGSLQPAILDVTGWPLVAPTSAPTPDAGDGIGPGSYLLISRTDGDFLCTANFLWSSGTTHYLGAAGHCFLPGGVPAAVGSDPYVKDVQVCVAGCAFGGQLGAIVTGDMRSLGQVVYARQLDAAGNDVGHDFGIVTVPSSLASLERPSMPVWGGPSGSATIGTGTPVCVYGNGVVLGETFPTKGRTGVGTTESDGAWYAVLPSSPGDSGSAVENCAPGGAGLAGTTAVGILTHLVIGDVGTTAGTTVARAQQMVAQDLGISLSLINGDGTTAAAAPASGGTATHGRGHTKTGRR
ncbi:MAG TPA: hypothetical protein VHN98_09580 [Acidimicrobiales bacterium]|nr:hypothetical protein [Acidimicrobiales bacterium]